MFAISYVNLLTLMKGTPTADPVAATGFPVTNLYDRWPWRPFRFSAGGVVNAVNFDTSAISENFTAPFVGGLPPGSYWSKTSGAIVTRNTASFFEGAASMAVSGGTTADYVALSFTWPADALFAWRLYLAVLVGSGELARVQLIDLDSRKRLVNAISPTWNEQGDVFAFNSSPGWLESKGSVRVKPPSSVGGARARLQLRFYSAGGSDTALYDFIKCWPVPDFVAAIGHNLPPSSGDSAEAVPSAQTGGILWKVGDLAAPVPAVNIRFSLGVGKPTAFALPSAITKDFGGDPGGGEFATLKCPRPPIQDPISYGIVWTGALTRLPEGPEYPIVVKEMFPQERAGGGGYETQAVRRGELAPRRLELSVSGVSVERAEEVFAALRAARYGTDRVVLIVPYKNVDTAFYGRVLDANGLATSQSSYNSVRASVVFEEEPFFRFFPAPA